MSSKIETGTEKENNFKYANVAVYCSKCNKFHEVNDPEFQKIQTGIFLTANSKTKLAFGCPSCQTELALVFIETEEPQVEDVEPIEEPIENSQEDKKGENNEQEVDNKE